MAVPGRLPRVVPHDLSQPFVVDGQVVPPGVGSSPKLLWRRISFLTILPDRCLHVHLHDAYQRRDMGPRCTQLQSRPLVKPPCKISWSISLHILQGSQDVYWSEVGFVITHLSDDLEKSIDVSTVWRLLRLLSFLRIYSGHSKWAYCQTFSLHGGKICSPWSIRSLACQWSSWVLQMSPRRIVPS